MAIKRKPTPPFKRKPIEIPPISASASSRICASSIPTPNKPDEIAGGTMRMLREHAGGFGRPT
jgi:hypothetical protein